MYRFLLTAACGLFLTGCGNFSRDMTERANDTSGWISEQLSGTGKAKDPAELVEFEPLFKPEKIWSKSLSDGGGRAFPRPVPAYYDDQVTVVTNRRRGLVSWDYKTHKKLWKTELEDKILGGVGMDEWHVFVATRNADLMAFSRETGELLWQQQMPSEVLVPPVSNSSVVVVATSDGKLLGLNANDGQQKWMIEHEVPTLSLRGGSAPLIIDDMVVKGFADGRMTAVDVNNGFETWETSIGLSRGRSELERMVDADSTPVAESGVIFGSAYQGRVVAIGQYSGEVLWSRSVSSYSGLTLDLFNVYLTDEEDTIWALDRKTGATTWKQEALTARRIGGPVVVDGYVVVADFDGYLHWMNRDDGTFVARSRPTREATSAPLTVIGNELFLFDHDGKLVILRASAEESSEISDDQPSVPAPFWDGFSQ
ncbi:MAG: outer membrane protein assembly factor BamB [Gammaproteobacteria bacterium]|nr:MAG: outer membrane protein assembly factor BamB [Gammaproteobacteria bacterium]RLA14506.1 MAG: outer membrane protein assembly factor BamB [Gammaproteobacteria bacterium]